MPAWHDAQAGCAVALARAAGAFGALDERLRRAPEGWHHRLALVEAADMSWHAGDRVPADRLALWHALRLGSTGDDAQALSRAAWALRRLTAGPGADAEDPRPAPGAMALHPIVTAAAVQRALRRAAASEAGGALAAAVAAARLGAAAGRGGARFLPLAMGGGATLRAGGPPALALAGWLRAVEGASRAALLTLDRVALWEDAAARATAGLSGRTPPLLVAALSAWPLLSAPMAAAVTGVSRTSVQRGLDRFAALGLIRELTGQGRFRFWTAAMPPQVSGPGL